ncbi:MAG: hypothetical protein KDD33_09475 [Bdellovibrionales bacterium]|nr:hypothetical protein [Bdellovibrionales bacterium]
MLKFIKIVFPMMALTLLGSCAHMGDELKGDWAKNMRGMAEAYEELIPYIYNSDAFRDPNNKKTISHYITELNTHSGSLDKHVARGLTGDDPLFEVGLKGLKTMINKAAESYYVESYDYSQQLLQASSNYCYKCHVRTSMGPTFLKWDQFEELTKDMNPLDHAKILIATRQFPKAAEVLNNYLDKIKKSDREEQLKALKMLMTVTLKNLESPAQARKGISRFSNPDHFKKYGVSLRSWDSYLEMWQKGQLKAKEAHTLIKVHESKKGRGVNYVEALHDSIILHKALLSETEKPWRARVYSALGGIYEKFPSLGFWELPESYFEACIYEDPGTKVAKRCYFSLESKLRSTYPKDMDSPLVDRDKTRLLKLKALANKKPDAGKAGGGGSTQD